MIHFYYKKDNKKMRLMGICMGDLYLAPSFFPFLTWHKRVYGRQTVIIYDILFSAHEVYIACDTNTTEHRYIPR